MLNQRAHTRFTAYRTNNRSEQNKNTYKVEKQNKFTEKARERVIEIKVKRKSNELERNRHKINRKKEREKKRMY